tara:strand:- start:3959 stop:4090 length:132 start_codon:yes stop_codon:yes gene_type:complete
MNNVSGPQLTQIREEFNLRVGKKLILGKSKKVYWESKRRFSNI